jgi:hypothetical protein
MFQSGSEGRTAQQCAVLTRLLSPLIFNIAMTGLDEHLMAPWKPGKDMSTGNRRTARRRNGLPTWRLVRYADDFVVLSVAMRKSPGVARCRSPLVAS